MVSSISQGTGSSLFDALRSLQKEQAETLAKSTADLTAETWTVASAQSVSAHAASSNLMSRNFAGARENDSTVKAHLAGLQAAKQMQNQATNRVTALLNSLGGIQGPTLYEGVGSKGGVPEATIQLAMKRIKDADSHDASERNLEETKESVEARAAEAMAPKDENGEPIETGITGTSQAAPMPEISGSNPAPAPEVSAASAPDGAAVAASTPEVSNPSVPASPSIDITV